MARRMTQRQLEKLVRQWQDAMFLRDWDVSARFVNSYDELEPDSHANCHSLVEAKKADLTFIHPDAYEDALIPEYDVELKVVHELLHLHTAPMGKLPKLAEEQAIEALSRTMLGLKCKRKRKTK